MTFMAWKATIYSAPVAIASGPSTTSVITAFHRVIRDGSVTASKTTSAGAKMTALAEPRRVVTLTMLAGDVDVGKGLVHHSSQPGPKCLEVRPAQVLTFPTRPLVYRFHRRLPPAGRVESPKEWAALWHCPTDGGQLCPSYALPRPSPRGNTWRG